MAAYNCDGMADGGEDWTRLARPFISPSFAISALAGRRVGLAVWRSIIGIGIDYRTCSISHDVKQRKNDGVAINIFQGGKLCA